jgi:hypothetical protein
MYIYRHHLHFCQISDQSDFKYGCQAAILENQLRAIDPKLCTYALLVLGKSNSQTKFRSDLILSLATRGPKPKTQKVSAITPEIMAGSSPKGYMTLYPGVLFYQLFKVTCRGQSSSGSISRARFVTPRAIGLKLCTY